MVQTASKPEILCSGAVDCRLFGWATQHSRASFSHRFTNRISHLLANFHHPNSLIVTFCSPSRQLLMLDTRSPLSHSQVSFGHSELSSTSRYLRPSWSRSGNLVALGTIVPETRTSALNVWDVRYLGPEGSPTRSIEFSGEKRFLASEFWPAGNTIVVLASDGSANFVDYT